MCVELVGLGWNGSDCLMGPGFLFGMMKKFWTKQRRQLYNLTVHFKKVNCRYILPPLKKNTIW